MTGKGERKKEKRRRWRSWEDVFKPFRLLTKSHSNLHHNNVLYYSLVKFSRMSKRLNLNIFSFLSIMAARWVWIIQVVTQRLLELVHGVWVVVGEECDSKLKCEAMVCTFVRFFHSFGFVMKRATLISIKLLDVEKKGNNHANLLVVSGFHDDEAKWDLI